MWRPKLPSNSAIPNKRSAQLRAYIAVEADFGDWLNQTASEVTGAVQFPPAPQSMRPLPQRAGSGGMLTMGGLDPRLRLKRPRISSPALVGAGLGQLAA